mmetsp:Transcript_9617/g.27064  ORF Transcript_9617/g.27064 Transcript_9617/m.27064 type:complete len:343 (+) Transcript_9617:68-1096(+)
MSPRSGSLLAATKLHKVITGALWAIVCASTASGTEEEASIGGNGSEDEEITSGVVIIAVVLVVVLILIFAVVFWMRQREKKAWLFEERNDSSVEVKEWLYRERDEIKGPFTNAQMRKFWVAGIVNRGTEAKVVWWTQDFQPISALFPQVGAEFTMPAKADEEEVEARTSDWHRFSVLAQPGASNAWTLSWYYKLPDGKEEGPFESGKMRHWFVTGFFDGSTLIRYEGAATLEFQPLEEHFSDVSEAFDVLPKGCSQTQARKTMQMRSSQQSRRSTAVRNSQLRNSTQNGGSAQALANSPGLQAELAELGASARLPQNVEPWRASKVAQPRASMVQTVGKETL